MQQEVSIKNQIFVWNFLEKKGYSVMKRMRWVICLLVLLTSTMATKRLELNAETYTDGVTSISPWGMNIHLASNSEFNKAWGVPMSPGSSIDDMTTDRLTRTDSFGTIQNGNTTNVRPWGGSITGTDPARYDYTIAMHPTRYEAWSGTTLPNTTINGTFSGSGGLVPSN